MRFASIVAIGLAAAAGALAAPTSHVDVPLQAFGYDPAFATEPVRVRKEWYGESQAAAMVRVVADGVTSTGDS